MRLRIGSTRDFFAGLLFAGFGLAAMGIAQGYPFGSAQRMGSGFFPTVLGGLLAVLGLITLIRSLAVEGPSIGKFAFRPLLLVLGAVIAFALTVEREGLALAVVLLIVISALAGHEYRVAEVVASAVGLAALGVLVFVFALQLPFNVWPW